MRRRICERVQLLFDLCPAVIQSMRIFSSDNGQWCSEPFDISFQNRHKLVRVVDLLIRML